MEAEGEAPTEGWEKGIGGEVSGKAKGARSEGREVMRPS